MKRILALLLLCTLPLFAAEQPVETDPRLHSDGKGWKLNQAAVKDPKRPRVLLIGDSILSGYMAHVIKALEGRAYVDAWVNPYCQGGHLNNTVLPEVLAKGPYDVVHFNMGLHGWQEGRIKPGTFEPLTKGYVEAIQAKLPKAKIIWASSTPVLLEGDEKKLDPVINGTIVEHNRMAAKVMAECGVPVSDFYSLLVEKLELARGGKDKFHWTPPAYTLLGNKCVESVSQALGIATEPAAQDVVIYGGTPGGIAAAVSAARMGREVKLVEYHQHIGGMTTSGLGKSDIENRAMIGGLFKEFVAGVHQHYIAKYGAEHEITRLCQEGYYYEPHVAEAVLESLIAIEKKITVLKGWRLKAAEVSENKLRGITIIHRQTNSEQRLTARVFLDATYEGDLYAAAGAKFRLGREPREAFDEPHAGVVYFDYQAREFLTGTTGKGDDSLPAYTYRLCLTKDLNNAARLTAPPPGYDRRDYVGYFDDLKAGRLAGPKVFKPGRGYNPKHFDTLVRALSVADIPNNKCDVNINPRPLGFPFPEENRGYLEGDEATRERIRQRHRSLVLGLLWFLQNDPEVPESHRELAREMHLPKDEFADNDHFPWQLYVREGRRLIGEYTLTQHDITGKGQNPKHHADSIAVGEFPIDSFPCRKRQPDDTLVLEGYLGMLDYITRPYEIPYRILIPEKIDGLIVPVAASTTHVAFSSIRMEPTWMALGQAAGVAAHLAIEEGVEPRAVSISALQTHLLNQGQVIRHAKR